MEPSSSLSVEKSKLHHWRRALQPLLWWVLLVIILYGIRTHQRLMEQTRLQFSIVLERQPLSLEATATLDGIPASNGQLVSLGKHEFVIQHPKAEPFSRKLFIWYGGQDFGTINLKRTKGVLALTIDPPAPVVEIQGPEFRATLTNSSGMNASVPTDEYSVAVRYRHWQENQRVAVFANTTNPLKIAPKFGALELTCNQTEASFQLAMNGEAVETGELPATITELPAKPYQLLAFHHNHRLTEKADVKAGGTNQVECRFQYGTVVLETKPPGAFVTDHTGHNWGTTPLKLTELQVGGWKFDVRLNNYEPATVALDVGVDETKTFSTNLVSQSVVSAMRSAREFLNAGKYDMALGMLENVLREEPQNAAATAMRSQAMGQRSIALAEQLGKQGNFTAGIKELEKALEWLPENARATQLLADFKKREPEQIERMRVTRMNRGRRVLDSAVEGYKGGKLFEVHELKTSKAVGEVRVAILNAFNNQPAFVIKRKDSDTPGTFVIEADHQFTGVLGIGTGQRRCVIVGSQITDDETQILFRILEYKPDTIMNLGPADLVGVTDEHSVPILVPPGGKLSDKLQARINEGITTVTAIIQGAIGQGNSP